MNRSDINPMPEYYKKYIMQVKDIDLNAALNESLQELYSLDITVLNKIGNSAPLPGKWSVKEIIQHLTDTERILSYRSLLIARKDKTVTADFNPDLLVKNSNANAKSYITLLDELKYVRFATTALFNSFSDEQLLQRGISWKYEISVLALGFNIIGHQAHHFNIIKEKYFPLANKKIIPNVGIEERNYKASKPFAKMIKYICNE